LGRGVAGQKQGGEQYEERYNRSKNRGNVLGIRRGNAVQLGKEERGVMGVHRSTWKARRGDFQMEGTEGKGGGGGTCAIGTRGGGTWALGGGTY
jgi:hypothetical protein